MIEREILRDGNGRLYSETLKTYTLFDINSQNVFQNQYPYNTIATVFPQLIRKDTNIYEGQSFPGITTYTTSAYDKYGNVNEYFDAGGYGYDDDVRAVIEYYKEDTPNSYIVGKPRNIRVFDSSNTLLRKREADYEFGTGNLIEFREYVDSQKYAKTNLDYYSDGNLKKITGPENEKGQRYSISYDYDSEISTYIIKIEDSFGLFSEASYNLLYGIEKSSKDTNNNEMIRTYDNFGRLITVKSPYDTSIPSISLEYFPNEYGSPPRAVTHNKIHFDPTNEEQIDTVIIIDGLKRIIQTKKEADVIIPGHTTPTHGMTVSGKAIFDLMGRVHKQGQPIFQAENNVDFYPAVPLKNPTINDFDVMGRMTKVSLPDGSNIINTYETENGFFKSTMTDPLMNSKISYMDAKQNIVRIDQYNNNNTIITHYEYNPINEMTKILDANGNITLMTYDILGRRTSINNPDSGLVEYTFDHAGNLVKKTDENLRGEGRAIHYNYEYNRLKRIDYPISSDVEYFYGSPGTSNNRAGRIDKISDESGITEFFYGKLGEEIKVSKTMNFLTPGVSPITYTSCYGYNY